MNLKVKIVLPVLVAMTMAVLLAWLSVRHYMQTQERKREEMLERRDELMKAALENKSVGSIRVDDLSPEEAPILFAMADGQERSKYISFLMQWEPWAVSYDLKKAWGSPENWQMQIKSAEMTLRDGRDYLKYRENFDSFLLELSNRAPALDKRKFFSDPKELDKWKTEREDRETFVKKRVPILEGLVDQMEFILGNPDSLIFDENRNLITAGPALRERAEKLSLLVTSLDEKERQEFSALVTAQREILNAGVSGEGAF